MKFVKNYILFSVCTLMASAAFAFPTPEQMKQNWEDCIENTAWYHNFGKYVVAFDIQSANQACGNGNARPVLASCKLNGNRVYAGYYCQTIF